MTQKLTPDQLHRLIDEMAELAYGDDVTVDDLHAACARAFDSYVGGFLWWKSSALPNAYFKAGCGFAGLSAVLILLSEGG